MWGPASAGPQAAAFALRASAPKEEGMALVLTMFMVLVVSLLGAAIMTTARTETLSSMNYRSMSQARYAAESGVHRAVNYLMNDYMAPTDLANYPQTPDAVWFNGDPIVLSSNSDTPGNYPVDETETDFEDAAKGTLAVSNGSSSYSAVATLRSIRLIPADAFSGLPLTVQTWDITGHGSIGANATVEVSAVLEQPVVPLFRYAVFATSPNCAALSFSGGATTDSYDSSALVGGSAVFANTDGNVGTNGNVTEAGNNTAINGSLSTPRSGVGSCSTSNVTALTQTGGASVEDGLVELPQSVVYPTPATPSPLPPTTATAFGNSGCPAVNHCASSGSDFAITPPSGEVVLMGNVSLASNKNLHLGAGIYHVNSITMTGNSSIIVDSGPVIIKVVGTGQTTPILLTGNGLSNPSLDPSDLQFIYGGTGQVRVAGGANNAALFYAPNADTALSGNSDFFGAIVTKTLSATGGVAIHYDRRLQNTMLTAGNTTMSRFSWKAF
jgi:Tfp pilus assembly protein PilX